MKIFSVFRLLSTFYRRNAVKNTMMVVFMFITNIVLGGFVIFFNAGQNIIDVLEENYFEYLSVDVSLYQSLLTNNELINVKTYKRPSLDYIHAMMEKTGRFSVRPDYSHFFQNASLRLYEKELSVPLITTYDHVNYGFGINKTYLQNISSEVSLNSLEQLSLSLKIEMNINVDDQIVPIIIEEEVAISFVIEEPTYFANAKLYVPQHFIDQTLGQIFVRPGETLNNHLLNVNPESVLANFRLRCHFESKKQRQLFLKLAEDFSDKENGLEVSSDPQQKSASFVALYDYLEILSIILLVFVLVGSAVIYCVVAHTSLLSNMQQMALISVLGAGKMDLYVYYLILLMFNFLLGLTSFIFLPYALPLVNHLFLNLMKVNAVFQIDYSLVTLIASGNFLFLFALISAIFYINMKRPLLNLLLDA